MKKFTTIALVAILTVSFTCLCAYAADNYSKFSSKLSSLFSGLIFDFGISILLFFDVVHDTTGLHSRGRIQ